MEIDSRQPVGGSRLRLVDVQIDGDRGHLKFGRHLSGVLTGTEDRSAAARWIAETVVGPRPSDSGGRIEVDGNVVSVRSLPSPLLPRSAPIVVDADLVRAEWHNLRLRQRDELAAVHASCRLESYRIDAALDHARARMWPTLAPTLRALELDGADHAVEPGGPVVDVPAVEEPVLDDVPIAEVPAVDWGRPPDEMTQVRAKLHGMVLEYEARDSEPLPEGVLLAAAFDAHTMLVRVREALGVLSVDANIEALEDRVNRARAAAAMGAGGVPDDARLRVDACHRVVVEAAAVLAAARRKERAGATARYEEAAAVELVALADAGFGSYDSYLSALTAGGVAADEGARRAAEEELAAARAALDAGREIPDVPTGLELDERETQMRARAAQLLGRAAGADPASELRALRLEPEARDDALAAIAELLHNEGIPTGADVVSTARAFLAVAPKTEARKKRAAPKAAPRKAAEPVGKPLEIPPNVVDPERSREVADLEEQKWTLDRRLARLEAQLARVDEVNAAPVVRLSAADFILTLGSVLDGYEHGDLLAGRLPLVLDGVLDGLSAETREAAVEVFARAEAVQTVVVTHDPEVMQSLARAGGTLTRWPEPALTTTEPELESSPASRP